MGGKKKGEDLGKLLARRDSEIVELRGQNEKLSRQIIKLVRTRESRSPHRSFPLKDPRARKLMEFIQRVSRRLDDDELYQVMVEEFLLELAADRVTILLVGSGSTRSLVATHQACQKKIKTVPVPYFVNMEPGDPYREFLDSVVESGRVKSIVWDSPVELHPEITALAACARALNIPDAGTWLISLQWKDSAPKWDGSEAELFDDMARYAAVMIEQTQLLSNIRELKDQKDSIIESMPSAIVGLDFLGSITSWNGKAREFFGLEEDAVIGRDFGGEVSTFADVVSRLPELLNSGEEELVLETRVHTTPTGQQLQLQPHLFNMMTSNRGELALRIDDITKQVDLHEQLVHAQKMEIVGTLAGGLAHDFNNILSGIVGTTSLVRKRWATQRHRDSMDWEDINIIEDCSQKAAELVNRLLVLSRKNDEESHPFNLVAAVENVLALCSGSFEQNVVLHLDCQLESAIMLGDRNHFENALLNLCVNARDAMPVGGEIRISVSSYRADEAFKLRHNCHDRDDFFLVKVSDDGTGMTHTQKKKAFQAFYTTKKDRGTGLGLTIVENVVEVHRGFIDMESVRGKGTTFSLYFPVEEVPEEGKKHKENSRQELGRALVVDDDPVIRKVSERILAEMDYSAVGACDGPEAVRLVSEKRYDLILLDVDMPGMNGIDTFRVLRQIDGDVPVLFCTGRRDQYDLEEVLSTGHCAVLDKPYSIERMEKALRGLFKGRS